MQYLSSNKVDKGFNGGLQVEVSDLHEFLKHFYCLTSCDASLPYFHFMDLDQNIVGFIHYSGEVRIDTLNKRTEELFGNAIKETKFIEVSSEAKWTQVWQKAHAGNKSIAARYCQKNQIKQALFL